LAAHRIRLCVNPTGRRPGASTPESSPITSIGRFERQLGEYILAWLPFGGPSPESVYMEFGVPVDRAVQILLEVAHLGTTRQLSDTDWELANTLRLAAVDLRRLTIDYQRKRHPHG
jgi:hypothetical protein